MDERIYEFAVPATAHRLRLERFLKQVRPDLSGRMIDRLCRTGAVNVRGKARDGRFYVKNGDRVILTLTDDSSPALFETPRIISRSKQLIALGKPPALATVPPPGHARERSNLLSWLENQILEEGEISGRQVNRPGVVHRLDKDTSGVVLFSLTPAAHQRLVDCFRRREVRKTYLALVAGVVEREEGRIETRLRRTSSGRVVPDERGQVASTAWRILQRGNTWSLLECSPLTGRLHQIRVHFLSIGHAVLGDPIYGSASSIELSPPPPRLWLHAASIKLPGGIEHKSGPSTEFPCPLWDDLSDHLLAISGNLEIDGSACD